MNCRVCNCKQLVDLFEGGLQPKSNDFRYKSDAPHNTYPFALGQCTKCGVIQLLNPIPARDLQPRFDWIKNKEPEGHLQSLSLSVLEGLTSKSRVLCISPFDKKLYEFIKNKIGECSVLLDTYENVGCETENKNQSLILETITPAYCARLKEAIGTFDVVVSCRLLEHSIRPKELIEALSKLMSPEGRLIIEVPDSIKPLLQGDVAMLWEEHMSYFTQESLKNCFQWNGFELERSIIYPYPQEDAVAAIFKQSMGPKKSSPPVGELALGQTYSSKVISLKNMVLDDLKELKDKCGEIAVFGAGHRASVFINLLGLADLISYVVDDATEKRGLRMPGTELEIISSSDAVYRGINVFLLAVSINVESTIKESLTQQAKREIMCYSISPDSNYALPAFRQI